MIGRSPERTGLNKKRMKHNYWTPLAFLCCHHASGRMVFPTCLLAAFVFATTAASEIGQYRANEARVNAIAANPQAIGPKEIEFLCAHSYFHQAIKALSEAGTPEARAALQTAALAGNQYAARLFIRGLTNKLEGLKLLESKSPEVQAIALRGLLGSHGTDRVILDRGEWDIIKGILNAENLEHRGLATRVTSAASSSEVPVAEKAQALAESMRTTLSSPEAPKASGDGSFVYSYSCPLGERVLVEQALALGGLGRGDSNGVIRELVAALSPAEPELVREGMMIARFLAGDHTLRGEVHRIATNSPSGRLRMAVLEQALNFRTVTEADRECLERVAATDPLEGRPGSEYVFQTGDRSFEGLKDWSKAKIYPARIQAQRSLRALDARTNPPPTGP